MTEPALFALNSLGFKERDARRALDMLEKRWSEATPPIEIMLREVLAVLT